MPAKRLSAQDRARRENLKKALEARRVKAVNDRIEKLRFTCDTLEEMVEAVKKELPALAREEIARILKKAPKLDIIEAFKPMIFELWRDAGGYKRYLKLLGDGTESDPSIAANQDKLFIRHTDSLIQLIKATAAAEKPSGPSTVVNVNILGRDEDDITIGATITPQIE